MSTRMTSAPLFCSGSTGPSTWPLAVDRTISASPAACSVVDPARASASISVMSPTRGYGPGVRTSPTTKTRWLRYCSTATLTCGFLKKPSDSCLPQRLLDLAQRQAARLHAADQRERERAVGLDGVLAAEVLLIEDRDRQHVLRADDVVVDLRAA